MFIATDSHNTCTAEQPYKTSNEKTKKKGHDQICYSQIRCGTASFGIIPSPKCCCVVKAALTTSNRWHGVPADNKHCEHVVYLHITAAHAALVISIFVDMHGST